MRASWIWSLAWMLATAVGAAQARVVEEQMDVPVPVKNIWGKEVAQTIRVTVWSDDANPRPAPIAIVKHGRAPDAQGRAALGRARYTDASRYLLRRGFVVVVPTRVGYGVSGGEDVEDTGACNNRNFAPAFAAAAQQMLAALHAVRQRPDVAPDRVLVIGQSFGGASTVALAAMNPPGVQAAINFAGGSGGDPKGRPQNPCSPAVLERTYGQYGAQAKVPMLWIYTENDMFFGPQLPRQWHAAFTQAGGKARFVQFPPHGEDGHSLFTRFPEVWQPAVSEFLDANGFAPANRP
ncbi:alpha/beta hydrolase family protein [Acidovorax sp.]|uniref:alpha/beta hydrolase family protein n=1 Tax=Acidovorax sp. TaxID=1872122 RepID=UPI00391FCA76